MKRFGIAICCFLLSALWLQAQETDTAMYRKLQISKIYSWVKLPTMPIKRDSCRNEEKHLNKQGFVTYVKADFSCFGWNRSDETFITYDAQNRAASIRYLSKDMLVSNTNYWYNNLGDIVKEVRYFYDPIDTLEMNYEITYDSFSRKLTERVVSKGLKGQEPFVANYSYNLSGKMLTRSIFNEANEKMAGYTYKYNDSGQVLSETVEEIKPTYSYTQQLYSYETDGSLKKHTNTADNTSTEYWFFPNGLVNRLYCYNRFGQMDREYILQYEYFENGR